ncbi:mitochondrial 2-oxodicarboxylate carrier isoform X1 [Gallus gallus]|uniref:mitochondrial 2-oxodicarboxylate carrier isoform X1 n=1 Tax=Gallus gallus TaxID=9031 RepID=UPI001AE3C1F9|nr:mitochondrial 2-oxodicarboxylate carrier isoform X1 [Gallus gallus]
MGRGGGDGSPSASALTGHSCSASSAKGCRARGRQRLGARFQQPARVSRCSRQGPAGRGQGPALPGPCRGPPADNRGSRLPPAPAGRLCPPPSPRGPGLSPGSAATLRQPISSARSPWLGSPAAFCRRPLTRSPPAARRGDSSSGDPHFLLSGLVEICLMHPLDVVKTRFQIQRGKTDPTSYKSLGDCFRTIFQREGLLGFYKGILPPILAETPKRAVKFFTFEQYRKLLGYASLPPGLAFAVAGLGSGLTEAIVVNPFEVVKVTLQANRNSFTEQPSSFVQAQQIIKTDGLGLHGLNKGLTATLGRHGVFNMVYFGFYFNVKNILPVNKDPNLEFLRKFGIGLVSGTIASIINIPFDVAKSRIQGPQPVPGEIKYRTCLKTMATVYKEEGFLALYKGLIPKIMRLGPVFSFVQIFSTHFCLGT